MQADRALRELYLVALLPVAAEAQKGRIDAHVHSTGRWVKEQISTFGTDQLTRFARRSTLGANYHGLALPRKQVNHRTRRHTSQRTPGSSLPYYYKAGFEFL